MLKVYGDVSKDELGGETEKDGSESAKNTGFTQNITAKVGAMEVIMF
ncbi:hypothetical protein ACIQY5_05535 [Peribacillus frigoritolerans]